jgi:excisionase family DNA binding protein
MCDDYCTDGARTYLPDDGDGVGRVYDFLAAHEQAGRGTPEPRYFLAGAEPGDQVELPQEAYRVLRQVIEAMRHNLAATVVPQSLTLTTQQAADLLGVSRPTVIKLLNEGRIRFDRTGTHRRILLHGLLAYRAQRRRDQYAMLEAMAADMADEDDPKTVLEELRGARRAVAARRGSAGSNPVGATSQCASN